MKSVYSAVRTGSLNKAVCASSLKVEYCQRVDLPVATERLPVINMCCPVKGLIRRGSLGHEQLF